MHYLPINACLSKPLMLTSAKFYFGVLFTNAVVPMAHVEACLFHLCSLCLLGADHFNLALSEQFSVDRTPKINLINMEI